LRATGAPRDCPQRLVRVAHDERLAAQALGHLVAQLAQRLQAAGEAVVPIIVLRDNERVEIDLPA